MIKLIFKMDNHKYFPQKKKKITIFKRFGRLNLNNHSYHGSDQEAGHTAASINCQDYKKLHEIFFINVHKDFRKSDGRSVSVPRAQIPFQKKERHGRLNYTGTKNEHASRLDFTCSRSLRGKYFYLPSFLKTVSKT